MGRAKGIIHKEICQGGQLLAKLGVVLGFALDIADVLQQHHVPILQAGGLGLGILAHHVSGHEDLLAQKLAQALSHHLQAQLRLPLPLGLAHMRAENDLCTMVHQVLNGGQSGYNPLVRGNFTVLSGHVEVAAAQHPLAGDVNIFNGFLIVVHGYASCYCPDWKPVQSRI